MEWIGVSGAYYPSSKAHTMDCFKKYQLQKEAEIIISKENSLPTTSSNRKHEDDDNFTEWDSNTFYLRRYIKDNITQGPKIIQAHMRSLKQIFTIKTIKETKKDILNELYPKDKKIAFYPKNCLAIDAMDSYQDNLMKYSCEFLAVSQKKGINSELLTTQEFYIFATTTMLFQLKNSTQWFIDGTFAIAPTGFQQVLVIIVLLPDFNLFYPACFILATNKTQKLYKNAFRALLGLARDEGFIPKPKTIMSDFETGLQNAIKEVFSVSNSNDSPKLLGCYFHFVKALVKKAKQLKMFLKNNENKKLKMLLGFLKLIVHCPSEEKQKCFDDVEILFKNSGTKFQNLLSYFKKNWLSNHFLEGLFLSRAENPDVRFIRTNNACELFNRYLGNFFHFFFL